MKTPVAFSLFASLILLIGQAFASPSPGGREEITIWTARSYGRGARPAPMPRLIRLSPGRTAGTRVTSLDRPPPAATNPD
jgi:hypothetical protein